MKRLYINRKKWLHGEGSQVSRLLRREDKKMCCLGFLAISCGATHQAIHGLSTPYRARDVVNWPTGIMYQVENFVSTGLRQSTVTEQLMAANDERGIPDDYREKEIKRLFRQIGISAIFTGKYE